MSYQRVLILLVALAGLFVFYQVTKSFTSSFENMESIPIDYNNLADVKTIRELGLQTTQPNAALAEVSPSNVNFLDTAGKMTADILKEQNFILGGQHMGIPTTLTSKRIPYTDLRSLPPVAKQETGPFMQSAFEEGSMGAGRRFFEMRS